MLNKKIMTVFLCVGMALFVFTAAAPSPAWAQLVCDDGLCDNVGRAYYEFGEEIDEDCHFIGDVVRPAGAGGEGFIVIGSGITIDGRGFCLDGVSPDLAYSGANGIYISSTYHGHGTINVTVMDLEIKNFWQGIKLTGTGSVPITGCVVDDCIIHDNGVSEDDAKYEGIWLNNAQSCTVTHCEIFNNRQGSGIANGEGDYNTFTYNELYNNYKHGIKAWWDSWYLVSTHNDAYDNGYGGINHRSGSNYGTLEYNVATNNTGPGISAGGTGNEFRGNISTDNISYIDPVTGENHEDGMGIDCSPSGMTAETSLYDNVACGNEEYDIYIGDDVTGTGENNTCTTYYNYSDPGTIGCAEPCEGDLPIAKFYADPTMVCSDPIQFHDLSLCAEGSTLTWDWDFGDGGTSTAQDPLHPYTESGIYSVILTVTMTGSQSGTDSVTREDYIMVCPYKGDIDTDSDVDGVDYYLFYMDCIVGSQPGWCDINGDTVINGDDMADLGLMDCLSCE